jgi:hypothetical protein
MRIRLMRRETVFDQPSAINEIMLMVPVASALMSRLPAAASVALARNSV